MAESDKAKVLTALQELVDTCKAGMDALLTTNGTVYEHTETKDATPILRKDTVSAQKLIYHSTTRLSIALGKPPPSYNLALEPIKDLGTQVGQLVSCISFFPSGILRREINWAAEKTVQALLTLAKHFLSKCKAGVADEEYLAKTGAVHEAVKMAEEVSQNEFSAFLRAWKLNGEALKDSLDEVKHTLEEKQEREGDDDHDDDKEDDGGWSEVLGMSTTKFSEKELERVKKLYPLFRFTTLLHDKILSDYIPHIKYSDESKEMILFLHSLLKFSTGMLLANDDLATALYVPQDLENIKDCVVIVVGLINDFDEEFGITNMSSTPDELAAWLKSVSLDYKKESTTWFKKCLQQIRKITESLSLDN